MLSDEPDAMQLGDVVFTPHLPRPHTWSVLRITGSYRYEIDPKRNDYGHILPVEILKADIPDADLTPALRAVRKYPARLRRLTREAYDHLWRIAHDQ
jgi:hypothetical protein